MKIEVRLGEVHKAIKQLDEYKHSLEYKMELIVERLASIGVTEAFIGFDRAIKGIEKINVTSEWVTDKKMVIRASGKEVAFIEFGTGATYGYGHPQSEELGVGPGTYPKSKGHWDDPKGWWYKNETGSHHTYGNAPSMTMYNTARKLEQELETVVKEVFG